MYIEILPKDSVRLYLLLHWSIHILCTWKASPECVCTSCVVKAPLGSRRLCHTHCIYGVCSLKQHTTRLSFNTTAMGFVCLKSTSFNTIFSDILIFLHTINHKMIWVAKDLKVHFVPWSSILSCHGQWHLSLIHLLQALVNLSLSLPGMAQPQPFWTACARASPPSQERNSSTYMPTKSLL